MLTLPLLLMTFSNYIMSGCPAYCRVAQRAGILDINQASTCYCQYLENNPDKGEGDEMHLREADDEVPVQSCLRHQYGQINL